MPLRSSIFKSHSSSHHDTLHDMSAEVRRMYKAESIQNFRSIYRLLATRSSYTLTPFNITSPTILKFLDEIGQFTEIAWGKIDTAFLWKNIDILGKEGYPLDRRIYDALGDGKAELLERVHGDVANLHAYIAYRPQQSQFVLAFSGTSSGIQGLQDVRTLPHHYKTPTRDTPGLFVHTGFWGMYKGVRAKAFGMLRKAREAQPDVDEVVICGHSMGGAMAYLFTMDLLNGRMGKEETNFLLKGKKMRIRVVAFGAPRVGNMKHVEYWRRLIKAYREEAGGEEMLEEYSVRAYMDGVPTLPLLTMGFRHYPELTYYLYHGKLYQVPASENEHCLFTVTPSEDSPSPSSSSLIPSLSSSSDSASAHSEPTPIASPTPRANTLPLHELSTSESIPLTQIKSHSEPDLTGIAVSSPTTSPSNPESAIPDAQSLKLQILYPRGGHNYYNRDLEKLGRSMHWVEKANTKYGDEWEKVYLRKREKFEMRLEKKIQRP